MDAEVGQARCDEHEGRILALDSRTQRIEAEAARLSNLLAALQAEAVGLKGDVTDVRDDTRAMRADLGSLKVGQVKLDTKIDGTLAAIVTAQAQLEKRVDRVGEFFHKYVWPLVMLVLGAVSAYMWADKASKQQPPRQEVYHAPSPSR